MLSVRVLEFWAFLELLPVMEGYAKFSSGSGENANGWFTYSANRVELSEGHGPGRKELSVRRMNPLSRHPSLLP